MNLLQLKLQGLWNSLRQGSPWGTLLVLSLVILMAWGEIVGVQKALAFLGSFGDIGESVAKRTLESALIVLTSGVAFSAITTAISVMYLSDDLNFLLAQPIAVGRVFALKVAETFISAAGGAALLTLPGLLTVGYFYSAPLWFYPVALFLVILIYSLPVGLGASVAVILMRLAPAGKVREVATGLGVVLSGALIYFARALKPEQLLNVTSPEQFDRLLNQFAGGEDTLLPPALAARALWDAAHGQFNTAIWGLALLSVVMLWIAGALAAMAYREGWVRGLESGTTTLNLDQRRASIGERLFAKMGQIGHILYKDIRLQLRDATQWSQLLILVALAGVYLVSIRAYPLDGVLGTQRFRNVIGYLQLAFQGFVVAGVGIRTAFPAISLEGYAYWLLQTTPLSTSRLVIGKFIASVPPLLILTGIMAWQSAVILKLSPLVATTTIMVGISSAIVVSALGVGLGAAFPRFKADSPSEIPMSPGGLLYMLLSLAYTGLLALIMARPAYLSITQDIKGYWNTAEGGIILILYLGITVLCTVWPLWYGIRKLDRIHD